MDSLTEGRGKPSRHEAPIAAHIVREAAAWMARLGSGAATETDHAACLQWRARKPDHERAWNRLAAMEQRFSGVSPALVHGTLVQPEMSAFAARRKAVRLLGLCLAAGGAAYLTRRSDVWQVAVADHATATGEQRQVTLPDGSTVMLNTGTAIDVDFSGDERLVILRSGEILVATSHDPAYAARPFLVQSRQGTVRALGTRFTVRQAASVSHVAVYEGLVELRPSDNKGALLRLGVGQQADFSTHEAFPAVPLRDDNPAWLEGLLFVRDLPLADVVADIARYRKGFLQCAPEVAQWRVSGVFSLRDTDRALENLTLGLPLEIRYRTRYWVTVAARSPENRGR